MALPYIIAVDFDGTLCSNKWPDIGEANIDLLIYLLKQKSSRDAKVILWTCRSGDMLEAAVEWCEARGLGLDAVNDNVPEAIAEFGGDSRKIFAHEYIDDKAVFDYSRYSIPFVGKPDGDWVKETSEEEEEEPNPILYECDRRACDACYFPCHRTRDIRHAVNFELDQSTFVEVTEK